MTITETQRRTFAGAGRSLRPSGQSRPPSANPGTARQRLRLYGVSVALHLLAELCRFRHYSAESTVRRVPSKLRGGSCPKSSTGKTFAMIRNKGYPNNSARTRFSCLPTLASASFPHSYSLLEVIEAGAEFQGSLIAMGSKTTQKGRPKSASQIKKHNSALQYRCAIFETKCSEMIP